MLIFMQAEMCGLRPAGNERVVPVELEHSPGVRALQHAQHEVYRIASWPEEGKDRDWAHGRLYARSGFPEAI